MLSEGARAPAFELPDLAGRPHALGSGPALAVFWKPRCATCDLAFPYLERLHQAYPSDRWQLLAVSQDNLERSAAFARQYALSFPVLIEDEGWPVSRQYDPEATPTCFLIGPDGEIEMASAGFVKDELNQIASRLAQHLGEAPQVIAEEDDGNPAFRPG